MRVYSVRLLTLLILFALLQGGGGAALTAPRGQTDAGTPAIILEQIARQLKAPVSLAHAGDGSDRLFIVEKKGRIVILKRSEVLSTPFLDITALVASGGTEQGLLSMAFHPRFTANGLFYVGYTEASSDAVVVARYRVSPQNPDIADATSAFTLLHVEKPLANGRPNQSHNGGRVLFGPDGYLYVGLGEGGSHKNPTQNAQDRGTLLGKLLRLDVDNGEPYAIPPDNPFVNEPGSRPEIWSYGLRNPWSFSFDRVNGDLYIADVGNFGAEEINVQKAGAGGGQNYGWDWMEGRHCYPDGPAGRACDPSAFSAPVHDYGRQAGCAVVGGSVYRGAKFPQLNGAYFFADLCSGRVWSLREQASGEWREQELLDTELRFSSFGEDEAGEIYLASMSDGGLYRLAAVQ